MPSSSSVLMSRILTPVLVSFLIVSSLRARPALTVPPISSADLSLSSLDHAFEFFGAHVAHLDSRFGLFLDRVELACSSGFDRTAHGPVRRFGVFRVPAHQTRTSRSSGAKPGCLSNAEDAEAAY